MSDYSKPIGWWCPTCGRSGVGFKCNGPFGAYHWDVGTTPVFAEIPADQRPETDEPDDETVCRDVDGDTFLWWDRDSRIRWGWFSGMGTVDRTQRRYSATERRPRLCCFHSNGNLASIVLDVSEEER